MIFIINDDELKYAVTNYYWSKEYGVSVNLNSGDIISEKDTAFSGTVREWYQSLEDLVLKTTNEFNWKNNNEKQKIMMYDEIINKSSEGYIFTKPTFVTVGIGAWKILQCCRRFQTVVENPNFEATLLGKVILKLNPYYPDNIISIGEFGRDKNVFCIEIKEKF